MEFKINFSGTKEESSFSYQRSWDAAPPPVLSPPFAGGKGAARDFPQTVRLARGGAGKGKKISIVGVEGAGKSVFISAFAQCMDRPGNVPRLTPVSASTGYYTAGIWDELQNGRWPKSTDTGVIKDLKWIWTDGRGKEHRLQILDCAGQDFRAVFEAEGDWELTERQKLLKNEFFTSDLVVILMNLQKAVDIHGLPGQKTQQLRMEFAPAAALRGLRETGVRVLLCFTQYDRYAELVANRFNGNFAAAVGVYLPVVYEAIQQTKVPVCKVYAVETEHRSDSADPGAVALFPKVGCAPGNLFGMVRVIDALLISQAGVLRFFSPVRAVKTLWESVKKWSPAGKFLAAAIVFSLLCFPILYIAEWQDERKINSFLQHAPSLAAPSLENASGATHVVSIPNATNLILIRVNAGNFKMGSPEGEPERDANEEPHNVVISRPYWLGKFEVTQAQWRAVMGDNPAYFLSVGGTAPMENINWFAALRFCKELTRQEREKGRLPEGYEYTLPTEAEWEYACRAGTTGRFGIKDSTSFHEDANYRVSNKKSSVRVGSYEPNAWGFHDMHGNVAEWCFDRYHAYSSIVATDPVGGEIGGERVRRGGSWDSPSRFCRSAARDKADPFTRNNTIGFRVALSAVEREEIVLDR